MSSQSSSSSSHATKADILYSISCLLADIDLVVERLDDHFQVSDVTKLVDMVDELVELKEDLLDVVPDGQLNLVDLHCVEEEDLASQKEEDEQEF